MNPKADFYFNAPGRWQEEIAQLRTIVLDCGLTEQVKWGCPCYTLQKSNIVLIHVFKEYCALLFFKGALLRDTEGILIQQTENVQSARQVRFTSVQEVIQRASALKAYVYEAIAAEEAGLKVAFRKTSEFEVPEEFRVELEKNPALKTAFETLTPGRQRAYLFHFSQPKRSETRVSRVTKYIPKILDRKGLED